MSSDDDTESALASGAVKPGLYECIWNIDGREFQGTIELAGGKFPHGTAKFTLASCAIPNGWAFPGTEQRDRVTGYIDELGRTVVLVGVTMSTAGCSGSEEPGTQRSKAGHCRRWCAPPSPTSPPTSRGKH